MSTGYHKLAFCRLKSNLTLVENSELVNLFSYKYSLLVDRFNTTLVSLGGRDSPSQPPEPHTHPPFQRKPGPGPPSPQQSQDSPEGTRKSGSLLVFYFKNEKAVSTKIVLNNTQTFDTSFCLNKSLFLFILE